MKLLNNTKRTRFKLVVFFGIGILAIGIAAVIMQMDGTATTAVVTLGGIIAKYTHDETKRPSSKEPNLLNSEEIG